MQETLSPALPPGYSLQEYTIDAVLGIGGFGITYIATDTHLKHKVAIKEFFPATLAIRNQVSGTVGIKSDTYKDEFLWGKNRYIQEAQTIAQFNHPNIVHVLRYFESNGTSYMVMALEEGESLEDRLKNNNRYWSENEILELIFPILAGLTEVHKKQFLHRDIKPENIILRSRDNSPVLIDFGSARSLMSTHLMTAMVTPGYGPVEQYFTEGGDHGPWSDIYALAAIVYRIIAGYPPPPSISRIKRDGMLPAVFAGNERYSRNFLTAIDHALAVQEIQRPQSIEDWVTLLTADSDSRRPAPIPAQTPAQSHPYARPATQASPRITHRPFQPIDLVSAITTATVDEAKHQPAHAAPEKQITQSVKPISAATLLKTLLFSMVIAILSVIGLFLNDKAQLTILSTVYSFGKDTRSPALAYPLICKNYFESHIVDKGLSNDLNANNARLESEHIEDISIDAITGTNATVSLRQTTGEVTKQSWFKPGFFWCRDILADYTPPSTKQPKLKKTKR